MPDSPPQRTDIERIRQRVHDLADSQQALVTGQAVVNEKLNTIMVRIDTNAEQRNRMEHMLDEVRDYMRNLAERQMVSDLAVAGLKSDMRANKTSIDTVEREVGELKKGLSVLTREVHRVASGAPAVSTYSRKKKAGLWTLGLTFLLGAMEFMHEAIGLIKTVAAKWNLK